MAFFVTLLLWGGSLVIGLTIAHWILRSAVRGGVEDALRSHHEWLHAHDQADRADG